MRYRKQFVVYEKMCIKHVRKIVLYKVELHSFWHSKLFLNKTHNSHPAICVQSGTHCGVVACLQHTARISFCVVVIATASPQLAPLLASKGISFICHHRE